MKDEHDGVLDNMRQNDNSKWIEPTFQNDKIMQFWGPSYGSAVNACIEIRKADHIRKTVFSFFNNHTDKWREFLGELSIDKEVIEAEFWGKEVHDFFLLKRVLESDQLSIEAYNALTGTDL